MRILIVHNTLNDSRSVSGVLRHYGWMAREWRAAGHPTDFVAARCGWTQLRELAPEAKLFSSDSWFDATSYLASTWRYFPAYAYRMASAHALSLPEKYDVVIASTQLIVEVYAAMVLARRLRAALVAKVHHVLAAQTTDRANAIDRLFLWSERRTTRWLNAKADLIICGTPLVSQTFNALENRLGLTPSPTVSVGYGIDLTAIPAQMDQPKPYDCVVLGRIHAHKGVFDLPEFWQAVQLRRPGSTLLIIGEGPHREKLQEQMNARGLLRSVTLVGGVSEAEKNRLLAQAKVGLSLSYEEGWGLSINEFLGAALPVVAYDLPIYAHVFPGQLDLVPPGAAIEAAGRVCDWLAHEDRRRDVGQRGREFVRRYDFRNVAREELEAMQSAAGR